MNILFRHKYVVLLCFCVCLAFCPRAEQSVLLNQPYSDLDPRYRYPFKLLARILESTEADYGVVTLRAAKHIRHRDKTLLELVKGDLIHVMAEAPKPKWDENLLVVPIPIRKGIQGFRVFIIHQNSQQLMASINSIDGLRSLATGSGAQWSTYQILRQAGFQIMTAQTYEGLFGMLAKGRFVTFGRGINEAYREMNAYKAQYPQLIVDEEILLNIPLPTYYYVSAQKPKLHRRIQQGLLNLIADGSFERLFYQYHCDDILQSKLHKRRVFKIDNPLASMQRMYSLVGKDFMLDPEDDFSALCPVPDTSLATSGY